MPTFTLLIGPPNVLAVEDEVFAMPTRRTLGLVNPVDATLEVSNAVGGTFTALELLDDGSFETAAAFIRNGSSTDCTVVLKSY